MRALAALTGAALLGIAAAAGAAPVSRPAELTLTIHMVGLSPVRGTSPYFYAFPPVASASANVQVDLTSKSIAFPADLLALQAPYTALEIGPTIINSLTMTKLGNLSATFSLGGAASIAGEPACPLSTFGACVPQSGFGGRMGVAGTLFVHVVPDVVVLPLPWGGFGVGLGGPAATPSNNIVGDPAPWTIRTGFVGPIGSASQIFTSVGGVSGSTLSLVSPTYVNQVGNVLPSFARLDITFTDGLGVPDFVFETVPEPAAALLAASLVGWLGWRARRRYSGGV